MDFSQLLCLGQTEHLHLFWGIRHSDKKADRMGIMFGGGTSRVVEIHGLPGCLDFKWLMWTLLYHDFAWVQLPVLLADLACAWRLGICLRGDGWRVVCRLWLWKLKEWRSFMNWWPTCSLPGVVCMRVWDFCLNSGLEHRYIPLFLNGLYPVSFYVWKVYFVYWF